MAFFDPLPPPEEPEEEPRPRWLEPLGDVVPATVAGDLLLAATPRMALIVTRASVYGDGMLFDLVVLRPDADPRAPGADFFRQLAGHLREDALRFGVLFADGRRATNLGYPDAAASPPVALIPRGGGGQPRFWRQEWWLWPLPPEGDVTFVCEWPAYEIPEQRTTLDGDLVREAARRTRPVWP